MSIFTVHLHPSGVPNLHRDCPPACATAKLRAPQWPTGIAAGEGTHWQLLCHHQHTLFLSIQHGLFNPLFSIPQSETDETKTKVGDPCVHLFFFLLFSFGIFQGEVFLA